MHPNAVRFVLVLGVVYVLVLNVSSNPVAKLSSQNTTTSLTQIESDESAENVTQNTTRRDLYVIKAVVYEIGILTEVDENSTDEAYSHERVDLTFYDAHSNGSHFDLGEIPLPIQTNVSGQVLTGIAPIDIGVIQNASDILSTLPLTGTIINITHSDTSFINLSHKPAISENGTILNAADIAKIPGLNGSNAILIDNTPRETDTTETSDERNSIL